MPTIPPRLGTPLIALISGVPEAIAPATGAVEKALPDAVVWNILDDRLITDATERGGVTPQLEARMRRLIEHAVTADADAVLITCSLYAHLAVGDYGVPVLGSDDAAFTQALDAAAGRIVIVSSVELALEDSCRRLSEAANAQGRDLTVVPVHVPGAREPAAAGDIARAAEIVRSAIAPVMREDDLLLFAQYSLSPAARQVALRIPHPVVAPPAAAATALAELLAPHELTRESETR